MSRIRSIHPGLWTDEEFVSLSAYGRLLFMGIWNECDDQGVFQWSPLRLKMRILPADNVDAGELLAEIEAAGCVAKFEVDGKIYGAVRNFCKFQRPKKPNAVHPVTPEMRAFTAANSEPVDSEAEPVPHQFPTSGEKAPQREEGGGNRKGKKEDNYAFSGRVIRLTQADKSRWAKAYPDLDIPALLQSRDDWLSLRTPDEQERWFISTSNWLSTKQQAAKTTSRGSAVFSGPC